MTDITQTMQWLGEGVVGIIPVWDSTGAPVGTRSDYNSYTVTFNANYKGDTTLFSKDVFGNDITLTLPAAPSGATGTWGQPVTASNPTGTTVTGNTPGATITGGVTATPSPTTAANYPAGSLSADWADLTNLSLPTTTSTPGILSSITSFLQTYQLPLMVGGAGLLLWLILSGRHHD